MAFASDYTGTTGSQPGLKQAYDLIGQYRAGNYGADSSYTTVSPGTAWDNMTYSQAQNMSNSELSALSDLSSYAASALQLQQKSVEAQILAQKEMQDRANAFSAEQAALNRQFQQASADKAMAFSSAQAALDREFQQSSAQKAMDFSAAEATRQMDFQERMSNTAYQRAVADLKQAGLNPILAVSNGSASSPAGSSGTAYAGHGSSGSGYTASGSSAQSATYAPSMADVFQAYGIDQKEYQNYLQKSSILESVFSTVLHSAALMFMAG